MPRVKPRLRVAAPHILPGQEGSAGNTWLETAQPLARLGGTLHPKGLLQGCKCGTKI